MNFNLIDDPARLAAVTTTNYRIVVTMRIIVCVMVVAFGTFIWAVIKNRQAMAIDILDSALLALVLLAGVDAAQFAAKRFSDRGYKAAGQAPQVITSEGGPITAAPGGTLQKQEAETPAVTPAPVAGMDSRTDDERHD